MEKPQMKHLPPYRRLSINLVKTLLALLCFFSVSTVFAQRSSSRRAAPLYQNEWLYGVNFNTNGGLIGGIFLKYATASGPRSYHSFPIDIVNIKHPKELKVFPLNGTNSYIQGKSNYLFVIRPQYGHEYVLFKKSKKQGVQVSAYAGVGPSIGLVAPYLISYNGQVTQYDPSQHGRNPNLIEGAFDFTSSLGNADLRIGASFKASLYFELGTSKKSVGGFEAGFTLDAYKDEIVIIPEAPNQNIITSAFLTFFYGIRS